MFARQWLGFLGFLGLLGVAPLGRGDWAGALWLVWFVWFMYFVPLRTPTRHSDVLQNNKTSKTSASPINIEQVAAKVRHLDRIMTLAREHETITNDQIEVDLGVSDATAERYLNELEHQGKLVQEGRTGRSVRYRLPV
jgi:predicted HTH transcriptional regulator